MFNFLKVHVLKKGIYADIYLENEKIATKKYFPYGYHLKNDFDKPGYISNWKTSENSDSFLDFHILKKDFPNKKNNFFLSYSKKTIHLKFVFKQQVVKEIEGKYETKIDFPNVNFDNGYELDGYYLDELFNEKFLLNTFPEEDISLFIKHREVKYPIYYQNIDLKNNNSKNPNFITLNQKLMLLSPDIPGYKFLGWFDNHKFLGEPIKMLYNIDYDVYLFPKLEIKAYRIKFLSNGEEILPQIEVKYKEKIDVSSKLNNKEGFNFGGWLYKGKKNNIKFMPAHDLILEAEWIPIDYKVTLNLNYERKVNNLTYNRLKEEFKLETPTRDGYSFIGWFLKPDLSGSRVYLIRTITMRDIQLFAKWEIKTHRVRLYDGETLYKEFTVQEGKKVLINDIEVNKQGLVFNGWSTKKSSFSPYDCNNLVYKDINLYAIHGNYKDISDSEYSIIDMSDKVQVNFSILNSCNIMKYEFIDFFINVHVLARNINEDDFYFEKSIETSNVWSSDVNLISDRTMNARIFKQIRPKKLKNYSLEINKDRLVYVFPGRTENVLNVFIKSGDDILFKKQLTFYNNIGTLLNSEINTVRFAIERSLNYIIYLQINYFGKVLDSQVNLLDDFQSEKLETNENININSLINKIQRSNSTKSLRDNNLRNMKKSLTVNLMINEIRDLLFNCLLLNDRFTDDLASEVKYFSEIFGFDLEESFSKIASALKDSNIELSLNLFNISPNDSKEMKLAKINKKYLEFSKKIISSNKKISQKAKEIVSFLANERKKLEE